VLAPSLIITDAEVEMLCAKIGAALQAAPQQFGI